MQNGRLRVPNKATRSWKPRSRRLERSELRPSKSQSVAAVDTGAAPPPSTNTRDVTNPRCRWRPLPFGPMEQDVRAAQRPGRARAGDAALTAFAALAATFAFLCGALAGRASGATRAWLLVVGALLAGGGVVAGTLQRRRDAARVRGARQVAEEA